MPVTIERPPFVIPEITADALERGARITEALRAIAQLLSKTSADRNALLLNTFFDNPDQVVVIPETPIEFVSIGWKHHKGKSELADKQVTDKPFMVDRLSISPYSEFIVPDWSNLIVNTESTHWEPQSRGVDAHMMYERYTFPLNAVNLAIFEDR